MYYNLASLLKPGNKYNHGMAEVLFKNIEACKALCEISKTSMGPNGMNKIIANNSDKIFVTSDTSTIINELDIVHPAAKLLIMAAQAQYLEMGDGTNYVIALAGELLGFARSLINDGVHPSEIISGYRIATNKVLEDLELLVLPGSDKFDCMNEEDVIFRIKGAVASKSNTAENNLCRLIARACINVSKPNTKKFSIENVRVAKIIGGVTEDSMVIKGLVIIRESKTSIKSVRDAKVAIYTQSLEAFSPESSSKVLIQNANDMINNTKEEEARLESIVKGIVKSGVAAVICGSSLSDLMYHLFEKYGLMTLHISSKFELQRVCQITGSCILSKPEPPTSAELGCAKKIQIRVIGDTKCVVIEQDTAFTNLTTIVLRGATPQSLDDMERAVNAGVNSYWALSKDARIVPGGGATEMEMAKYLTDMAGLEAGLEQYSIQKFAEALEIIPRTLAQNSGLCDVQAISALWSAHSMGNKYAGLLLESGQVVDQSKEGVVDIFLMKYQALKILTDLVIRVLKIDHIIMAKQTTTQEDDATQ
jgi:T-complex protein 1 subunit theta